MKKLVMVVALLSSMAFAQDAALVPQQRVIELKNTSDYGRLEAFVQAFGVGIKPSPNERYVVLRGTKEQLDAAEAAIRKIDIPKKDVELVFQIVAGTAAAGQDKIPQDLEPVIRQLKKNFVYQNFRLVDSIEVRTREGKLAEASSAVQTPEVNSQMSFYRVSFGPALSSDEKGTVIRLDNLHFSAKIPVPVSGPGGTSFNYIDTGINQNVDVREGQKVVVGRANLNGKDGAFFLVVTAKVVD